MQGKIINALSAKSLMLKLRFNGQDLATGTGFVVLSNSGPLLITNRHNVTGRDQNTGTSISDTGGLPNEIAIMHHRKDHAMVWVERTEPLFADDRPLWIEHPSLGERADFVAIPLTRLDDVEIIPYDIDDTGPKIYIGPPEQISVIGFPFGKTAGGHLGIWATGFVASEPALDFSELPVLLIDCRTRPGQSGSPVVAFRNVEWVALEDGGKSMFREPVSRLVGIYSGRIRKDSDIGMVWKAEAIRQLVRTLAPDKPNYGPKFYR